MTLASFLSSLIPSAACEEPQEEVENPEEDAGKEEEEAEAEEEEEEEPEDPMVELREECKEAAACIKFTKHFDHCQEKVEAGEGFKGEDCVEEMFHMMHCVDNCVAPKLFAKLR
ncbi:QCR6 [Sanghuangporus sanghuang]